MIDGIDTQAGPTRKARVVAHHPGDGSVLYLPIEYNTISGSKTFRAPSEDEYLQPALAWYNSQFGEENQ